MTDKITENKQLNWFGEFRNTVNETKFRNETWSRLRDQIGKTSLLAGIFFFMAGAAPFFIREVNDLALSLLVFRGMIALWGFFIFITSSSVLLKKYLLINISFFIILMGLFESYEAVLTYRPEFEYNIPFTLLIILLSYLLFPLSVRSVAPASIISSSAYIMSLGFFTPARWPDLIQLSVFFLFINLVGLYIFIELSRNRRYRYLSYKEINKLYFLLNEEIKKKDKANIKLSVLAETDELTGIANRRKFFSSLQNEFTKAYRYKRPLSILMMDIDFFKKVNDTHGHDAGDQVIIEFTERCKNILRQSDIIGRVGGEEFAVLLPETSEKGALILAERIRESIVQREFSISSSRIEITASCGLASIDSGHFDNITDFMKAADSALYLAKNSGRNMSCVCGKINNEGILNENN